MADHGSRDHATWSASSTERNWACPGALALTMNLPERTSEAADWGTACHQVAEKCLRSGKDAADFIGTTEKGKEYSFEVDDEMAETAQMYVDYVRARIVQGTQYKIEQKFSLASLNPPFEAGGTADAVICTPRERKLEVVDLKGGRGHVVEVVGNPQLRTYALGAMLANPGLQVDTITVTIVQPRAPHKSGRIRSETFYVADLLEWTGELLAAMKRSSLALSDRVGREKDGSLAFWNKEWLKAGDHCKFCKAAGFCPALQQKAYDAAALWFDDQDQPRLANSPDAMSPEALAQALDAADMIGDWINAVRSYAHAQAESGIQIPNYVLVPKEGREKWNDGADQQAAAIATKAGLDPAKVFNPAKVRTPKQLRDALAKAKLDSAVKELSGLSAKPEQGTNLVRADKTTRQAVKSTAETYFEKMT